MVDVFSLWKTCASWSESGGYTIIPDFPSIALVSDAPLLPFEMLKQLNVCDPVLFVQLDPRLDRNYVKIFPYSGDDWDTLICGTD